MTPHEAAERYISRVLYEPINEARHTLRLPPGAISEAVKEYVEGVGLKPYTGMYGTPEIIEHDRLLATVKPLLIAEKILHDLQMKLLDAFASHTETKQQWHDRFRQYMMEYALAFAQARTAATTMKAEMKSKPASAIDTLLAALTERAPHEHLRKMHEHRMPRKITVNATGLPHQPHGEQLHPEHVDAVAAERGL